MYTPQTLFNYVPNCGLITVLLHSMTSNCARGGLLRPCLTAHLSSSFIIVEFSIDGTMQGIYIWPRQKNVYFKPMPSSVFAFSHCRNFGCHISSNIPVLILILCDLQYFLQFGFWHRCKLLGYPVPTFSNRFQSWFSDSHVCFGNWHSWHVVCSPPKAIVDYWWLYCSFRYISWFSNVILRQAIML